RRDRGCFAHDSVPRSLRPAATGRSVVRRQHDAEGHAAGDGDGPQVKRSRSHHSHQQRVPHRGPRHGLGEARLCGHVRRAGANGGSAEMTTAADPREVLQNVDLWIRMYRQMLAIRLFEGQVNELYTRALMPGLAHLYIGEEAVAVGVCEALEGADYITSTHRGH